MLRLKRVEKYSLFIHPRKNSTQKKVPIKTEESIPSEFKWASKRITLKEISMTSNKSNESNLQGQKEEKEFNELINQITVGKKSPEVLLRNLIEAGVTFTEAQSILDQSIYHSLRAADWAHDNEINSGKAANWILVSIPLGILKIFLTNLSPTPLFVNQVIRALTGFTQGMRGYKQFKIYGERLDDDRAESLYCAEKYGNKVSGFFADLAYLFETKINPYLRPTLGFFSEKIQDAIEPLLLLGNVLWWRIRMPSEINQTFATDILRYIFYKPLAIFRIKKGIEGINKIDKENLTYKYINKRARSLIGLDEEKDKSVKIISKFFKEAKSLFSKHYDEKIKASVKINKFISPFLGLYGFFIALIGTPLKSVLSFFNKENKYIDAITQTNIASQQLIYLFRLMLPEHFENIKTIDYKSGSEIIHLKKKRIKSFYTGLNVCVMNLALVIVKLFNFENKYLKLGMEVFNEIADKGIPYYLSSRRALLGTKFKLDNPELFNSNGTPVTIN